MRRRHVSRSSQESPDSTKDDPKIRRELHARQRTLPSSSRSRESSRLLIIITAGLAGVVLSIFWLARSSSLARQPLPTYFALCSSEGRAYTSDLALPQAECVVVEEGIILHVGSLSEVREKYGDVDTLGRLKSRNGRALKIKLLKKGWSVIPGLIDSHAHPMVYGEAKASVDLVGCTSTEDVVRRIVAHIESHSELRDDSSAFILGLGWDQTLFPSRQFPTTDDLAIHPLLSDRPIVLTRIDTHAYWVSRKVIELAGDLRTDVDGGTIFRHSDGSPSGVFLDNAMSYILRIIPPWTDDIRLSYLRTAASDMLKHGLTAVHDAAATPETISFYRKLDEQGRLPIRINAMVDCGQEVCADRVEKYEGDRLSVRSVKILADGALGSWGAAMFEPYSDNPSTTGLLRAPADSFLPLIRNWSSLGWQLNAHAIGDRANSVILDAFETVISEHPEWRGTNEGRFRIEHAQILKMEDIERMGRLNIVASVQPTHATADMWYAESRLGPDRIPGAYAWQKFISHNITLALGSDFPVSPVSPFLGLHAAIARTSSEGASPDGPNGWYPGEKLSPGQALDGFTRIAAWAAGWEKKVGSLERGKKADLVVLEGDVVRQDRGGPLKAKVKATILDGLLAYGSL